MEQIKNLLEARGKELLQLKAQKEKALKSAPEGTLRVNCQGNRTQYYRRNNSKDLSGVYIKEKDFHIAQKLAQKDYNKKVLRATEKELAAINKYLSSYPTINAEQVYEKLHTERQKMIIPIRETDEQYVSNWKSVEYQGKVFFDGTPKFYTAKGERVRSKSEIIIADMLNREGIPYRYEYPLYLNEIGSIYPDFTVLNVRLRKELFWEHLGMMDDATYVEKAIQKIAYYEENGIFPGDNLILTYETKQNPLNQKTVKLMIQHYLQ